MKAFIIAAATLLILLSAVAVNSALICGRIDELLETAALLPELDPTEEGAEDVADRLYSLWDGTVEPLSYTVGYQLIDRADDAIEEIVAAVKSKNDGNYVQALRRFTDALKRMKRLQGLTFSGVF